VKEVTVAKFDLLPQDIPEGNEENHAKFQNSKCHGQNCNWTISVVKNWWLSAENGRFSV
jgi:hypothetical protein